ncbi:Z1 domain-containing protein [Candidatus Nitrotoga sp. M5]|uniref:Z1 domain-containing protein n=1 Tax=Candidatus Nitrotoga sp. M5 TaxID=2890409 RepID=UPI001EF6D2EB|nr:Z1 domain-containing protein [Candidatus Nitrotoga sp. M5]CAH1387186.1 Z1 domain-containing protein [Candidatus Nitrotoga sp. M5]
MSEAQKTFLNVVSIAQTILHGEKDKSKITPALIAEKVDLAMGLVAGSESAEFDRQAAISELIRRFSLWIGQDSTLHDEEGHEPWLVSSRKKDWRYWQRYQGFLERKMATTAVDALDKSTDKILAMLEDPNREGTWDRRGLVVGHVQSGKTGNYSGLVCKAADAGYKIIIVLAGLHNNLRSQTQIRLEESFLGYETSFAGEFGKTVGVGEIDTDSKIRPNCATTRADKGDFTTKVAKHLAISPEQRPWLFVVKKNKTVLERLLKWIRSHVADAADSESGRRFVSNLPLLLIDDESDHASVDTGEQLFNPDGTPDDEHQPKAINSRIRKILHSFAKSAYVGYTATPFANIFIHRRNETTEEGPDLFPQSFIINLAAPSNYVGPARVFGLNSPDGRIGGLPLTRDICDHVSKDGSGGWMPPKHNKEHIPLYEGLDAVPPSMREAIGAFILACATRTCRGQDSEHSSMLIHVTRLNLVQKEVYRQVEEIVKRMRQRITRGVDHEALLAELHSLWDNDFLPTCAEITSLLPEEECHTLTPSWEQILAALPDVLSDIDVRMINGTAKDALDYAEHQGMGLKIIAIGGDKLSRGLTLEGLCVSYFVRTSKMYDTLMQMGRWFGYRPGYIDLCRLYTTVELVEWFGHIADASEELREEFDAMVESGGTPKDYGLKVQSHPILMVTSPLKMRTAETLLLSYSGSLVQTVAMYRDPAILRRNLDATNRLISALGDPDERGPTRVRDGDPDKWKSSFLWNGVGANLITDFLTSYSTHPKAPRANSSVIAEFVGRMVAAGELTSWTVALLGEGQATNPYVFANGLKVAMPYRADTKVEGSYSIGVLTEPGDEAIDLDYPAWKKALDWTLSEWKPDPARNRLTRPIRPSGKKVRNVRGLGRDDINASPERGVLLLYPLSPKGVESISSVWSEPIMAFAISFPSSNSAVKVAYKVDHLLWEQEYGPAD